MSIKNKEKYAIPIMAFTAGTIVANVYYSQPILKNIAETLGEPEAAVGKVSMLAQIGYGIGMFFLLPLGDKINRKRLIIMISIIQIFVLMCIANTTHLNFLLILSFLAGVCSTPAQIILPMAALLNKENRGKSVGIVFSGILCGILGSRLVSGWLTDLWEWQSVFTFSAIMISISIVLMWQFLPNAPIKFKGSYIQLLQSTLRLVKEHKTLRQAALLGSLTFGIFCSFWTTLTFHLSGAPFNYTPSMIGMFAIVAIGGALVAPYFGKLADKGQVFQNLFLTISLVIISLVGMLIFPNSIIILIIAIFLLDIGVQATQITNFTRIYALSEEAHSRLNTVYMTAYFIGAGIGTFFGLISWSINGWLGSLTQMLLWSFLALGIVFLSKKGKL
ncbi:MULTISPECIES: MFS transporter [Myroides]|uniref:MFS transporter n=1 Tax=Myroides TaxID=76831 RepID=UPI00057CD5FB|nr:MFS transporter [Myroides sp. A21]AJA70015.1 Arabinose efflux permease [Myroides sp. A21]